VSRGEGGRARNNVMSEPTASDVDEWYWVLVNMRLVERCGGFERT
jgi:hypothetical protein